MLQTTLTFVFNKTGKILLAMKKRGFGEGKWNGAGGKLEEGESIEQAAVRELHEEAWVEVTTEKLENVGVLHCFFTANPENNRDVHVFVVRDYTGAVEETEEMRPQWFGTDEMPYDDMWDGDKYWIPRLLDGEKIEFELVFDEDGYVEEYVEIYNG